MNFKKVVVTGLAAAAAMAAGAGIAMAGEHVGGGEWEHGVGGGRVWSNYYHPHNCHSSKVDGEQIVDSGPIDPGYWSYASSGDTIWVDETWWNNNRGGC